MTHPDFSLPAVGDFTAIVSPRFYEMIDAGALTPGAMFTWDKAFNWRINNVTLKQPVMVIAVELPSWDYVHFIDASGRVFKTVSTKFAPPRMICVSLGETPHHA